MLAPISVFSFIPKAEHAAILAGTSEYDCQPGIQAAIDYSLNTKRGVVKLPSGGVFNIDNTIKLGITDGFRTLVLEGDTYNLNSSGFTGPAIRARFSDRPAIAVSCARGTVIRGIGIHGLLRDWILDNNFATNEAPVLDDLDPDNWNDPSLAATQDSRYAPYAGIAIDPYAGVQPDPHYPDVTYGGTGSSDVLIDNCLIDGFSVGVACMPSDNDGGGDFHQIRRSQVTNCKWGVSVGNSQSRNLSLYDVKMARVYCALTSQTHGKQIGMFASAIVNLSIGGVIKLLDVGAAYAGPMEFISTYLESAWSLGTINASSASCKGFRFSGGHFGFHAQVPERGYPAYLLDGQASECPIHFENCAFDNYKSVAPIGHISATFAGCDFEPNPPRSADYEKFAHNLLCGGLVTLRLARPAASRLKSNHYDLASGDAAPTLNTALVSYGGRNACVPLYAELVRAGSEAGDRMFPPGIVPEAIAKASLAACSLNGLTLTISFTSREEWQFLGYGPLPGDVIWDDNTGSVFFISARDGLEVEAILQNNYRDTGAIELLAPFSTTGGNLYIANSRAYTPTYRLRGDLAAGSAIITDCARDDDFAAWYDAEISVGDSLLVRDRLDNFVSAAAAIVVARDQSAGTITLSSNSGVRTQDRRRLDYFIRTPPANA